MKLEMNLAFSEVATRVFPYSLIGNVVADCASFVCMYRSISDRDVAYAV